MEVSKMKKYIDINADIGEGFGAYAMGNDEALMKYISSVNIACGWHAGDANIMAKTVALAIEHDVAIGAHPGFLDLQGFGRRKMEVTPEELKNQVIYQVGALEAFVKAKGGKLQHIKPHGAMYNMAAKDKELALAISEAIYELNPSYILLGLAGSKLIEAAKEVGLPYAREVFADRSYRKDGSLVPRNLEGAMIEDEEEAILRVKKMIEDEKVKTIEGNEIFLQADSVCVHGDSENSLFFAKKLRYGLENQNIKIQKIQTVIGYEV